MRTANRNPSAWVARIERSVTGAPGEEPEGDARSAIANARARVEGARGASTKANRAEVSQADAPLYEALVEWRLRLSRAANAPAYVIFPNSTLAAIATARPRTQRALLAVPGIGPVKAERYVESVLTLVAEHAGAATVS